MIPFYRPYFDHQEIVAALRPGAGRDAFEEACAAHLGARYGVAFAHARSGLWAALKVLGVTDADVVLTAYTCVVMPQTILAAGNRPVFVDIDPTDFNMDLGALRPALTPRTRAVIVTHLFGYEADVEAVRAIVGDERVLIVEDCAQKLMARPDRPLCLRGDVGMCSFGINKELCTVQGGVMVTNSAELYRRLRDYRDAQMDHKTVRLRLRRWARLLADYVVFRRRPYGALYRLGVAGETNRLDYQTRFEAARLLDDHATALLDLQGRVGLVQLRKLETVVARRRAIAELYTRELEGTPGIILPPLRPDATFAYYTLRVPRRQALDLRGRMLQHGVAIDETYEYALPLLQPYRRYADGAFPGAAEAARQVVNLPIYPHLSLDEARYVAQCLRAVCDTWREAHG